MKKKILVIFVTLLFVMSLGFTSFAAVMNYDSAYTYEGITLSKTWIEEANRMFTPVQLPYIDTPVDLDYSSEQLFSFRNSISSVILQDTNAKPTLSNPSFLGIDANPFYGAKYNSDLDIGALALSSSFLKWNAFGITCDNSSFLQSDKYFERGVPYCFSFALTANSIFFSQEYQEYETSLLAPPLIMWPRVQVSLGYNDVGGETSIKAQKVFELLPVYKKRYEDYVYFYFHLYFYFPELPAAIPWPYVGDVKEDVFGGLDIWNLPLSINSVKVGGIYTDPVTLFDDETGGYAHAFNFVDFTIWKAPSDQTDYSIPPAGVWTDGSYRNLTQGFNDALTDPLYLLSGLYDTLGWTSGKIDALINEVPFLKNVLLFSLLLGIFSIAFGVARSFSSGFRVRSSNRSSSRSGSSYPVRSNVPRLPSSKVPRLPK